jgi:hypothetical protein
VVITACVFLEAIWDKISPGARKATG